VNWDLALILGGAWLATSVALVAAFVVLPRQVSRRRMRRQLRELNAAYGRAIRVWYGRR
jgi:hypothetical protein